MFDFGGDFLLFRIVGQGDGLLEFRIGEFATQKVFFLLFLFFLFLLFYIDGQVVLIVQIDLEVVFGHTGSRNLNPVLLFGFDDVDRRSREIRLHKPFVAEEIVEDARQPVLIFSCR